MSEKFTIGDELPAANQNQIWRGGSSVDGLNAGETINGSTLPVAVYQNTTDNEFYVCDADDTAKLNFTGFAISNSTDGNSIDIQFEGIVKGFTGLAEGTKYYVQDDKTIGTTAGTYLIEVGKALSETELLITNKQKIYFGTDNFSATDNGASDTNTQICGFRPNLIIINFNINIVGYYDVTQKGSGHGICDGSGNQGCSYYANDNGEADNAGYSNSYVGYVNIADAGGAQIKTGILLINNFTNTGFDVSFNTTNDDGNPKISNAHINYIVT